MANVKSTVGFYRIATNMPAKAALLLIERAAAANRSLSAYIADVLMASLHHKEVQLPRLKGGRGPRSDADLVKTAARIASKDTEHVRAREAQVERQRRNVTR